MAGPLAGLGDRAPDHPGLPRHRASVAAFRPRTVSCAIALTYSRVALHETAGKEASVRVLLQG